MLKIIGILSVLLSCASSGMMMSMRLKNRVNTLNSIYQNAVHIKNDLEYRAADVFECFCGRGKLFNSAYCFMTDEGITPGKAIKKACENMKELRAEDIDIIFSYGDNLECEDLISQIENILWLTENVALKIKDANDEYKTKSRLYKSGGIIVGFGVVILLL